MKNPRQTHKHKPRKMGPRLAIATSNNSPHRLVLPLESIGLTPSPLPQVHSPTAHALATQQRRLLAVRKIGLYLDSGYGKGRSAQMAGVGLVTAWRWSKLFESGGEDALLPQTSRCGRRPRFSAPNSVWSKVEALALQHGSRRKGWLKFAGSADCPVEFARAIRPRSGRVPKSLMDKIPMHTVNAKLLLGPTQFCIVLPKGGAR